MGRDPSRKKPRRKRAETNELAPDLVELATIIAENRLATDARGWFELPWRSGWNVAWLGVAIETRLVGRNSELSTKISGWIAKHQYARMPIVFWYSDHAELSLIYQEAESYREPTSSKYTQRSALLVALRAIQLEIARSSGGGHVYNALLIQLLSDLNRPPHYFADLVMQARCKDALGTTIQLKNDADDRKRRAFKTAWERGLYHAAYAIGPVKP